MASLRSVAKTLWYRIFQNPPKETSKRWIGGAIYPFLTRGKMDRVMRSYIDPTHNGFLSRCIHLEVTRRYYLLNPGKQIEFNRKWVWGAEAGKVY